MKTEKQHKNISKQYLWFCNCFISQESIVRTVLQLHMNTSYNVTFFFKLCKILVNFYTDYVS